MKGDGWQTLGLSDLEPILAAGVHWKPPRRTLGIEAFGTNAYGAKQGEPYMPSAWEWFFEAEKFRPSMDADAALAFLSEGLERFPDHMGMLFSIACWQAMGGREDEALETLRRAEALDPRVREWVAKDEDLASVRDRFFEEQPKTVAAAQTRAAGGRLCRPGGHQRFFGSRREGGGSWGNHGFPHVSSLLGSAGTRRRRRRGPATS